MPGITTLKKKLDDVFSKYIRLKFSDSQGYCICYTCGKKYFWKKLQNGHFIPRNHLPTRWLESNCRPQCVGCNMYGRGKPLDFEDGLVKELGKQFVDRMKASRYEIRQLKPWWYEEQIEKYSKLVKEMRNDKNL